MIQAIYFMIKMTLNFLIIFACWLVLSSAVFTAIYYDSNDEYRSFSVTLTTLFSASLAVYDNGFSKLEPLGSIMISIYVVISAVMLINLLIALLTEAFSEISKQANSRHRAILISYRHRWAWNPCHSYLIFTPPPINSFAFLLVPFGIVLSDKYMVTINNIYCKLMFIIIYALPMILVFIVCNILLVPFAWIKGFASIRNIVFHRKIFSNLMLWTFTGVFILIIVIFKDVYNIAMIALESIALQNRKEHSLKNNWKELKQEKKLMEEKQIYTNFIKSIIKLFDEFEYLQAHNDKTSLK